MYIILFLLGTCEADRSGNFEVTLNFKSQMEGMENVQMDLSNKMLNKQAKSHFLLQWSNNKKIELSGNCNWANNMVKADLDLTTPFSE